MLGSNTSFTPFVAIITLVLMGCFVSLAPAPLYGTLSLGISNVPGDAVSILGR